jgi:hypothetical protein
VSSVLENPVQEQRETGYVEWCEGPEVTPEQRYKYWFNYAARIVQTEVFKRQATPHYEDIRADCLHVKFWELCLRYNPQRQTASFKTYLVTSMRHYVRDVYWSCITGLSVNAIKKLMLKRERFPLLFLLGGNLSSRKKGKRDELLVEVQEEKRAEILRSGERTMYFDPRRDYAKQGKRKRNKVLSEKDE